MSVSNESHVTEQAVARLLRATRANDADKAPKRHPRQTDQCPTVARFAAVCLPHPDRTKQPEWTQEEARHTRACPFCQDMFRWFRDAKDAAAKAAALAAAPPADAGEETLTNLDTSEETQTELPAPGSKKGAGAPEPHAPQTKKPDAPPGSSKPRTGE